MNEDSTILGIAKCRKFTRLVDYNQAKTVVTAALPGHYCDFASLSSGKAGITGSTTGRRRGRANRYFFLGSIVAGVLLASMAAPAWAHSQADQTDLAQSTQWVGETGIASYYGEAHQGRKTASGARFNQEDLTAAHPWLPFGTRLRVTVDDSGRSVVVVITDRLYSKRRVIDLSVAAAKRLGIMRQGIASVSLSPA
jgi:rare lipoprotein A